MPTANKICVNSKCRLLIINQKEYILKSTHSLDFEAKQIWVLIFSSYLTATGFEALISFNPLDVNGTTVFTSMCCRNSTKHCLFAISQGCDPGHSSLYLCLVSLSCQVFNWFRLRVVVRITTVSSQTWWLTCGKRSGSDICFFLFVGCLLSFN